jgi:hypothetical protein
LNTLPQLRTSERTTFERCRYLWYLNYVLKRRPIIDRPPLRFGTLIHGALAAYYKPGKKRGPHPAKTFEKLYAADAKAAGELGFRIYEDDVWANAAELGPAMLNNYVNHYGADDEWEVLVTEHPFNIKVKHHDPFVYTGVVDGVWRHLPTSKIWIPDHKTTTAIERNPSWLLLDEQAGAYWTFGLEALYRSKLLPRSTKLAGMLYNFLRKQFPDERPKNELGQSLNKDGSVSGTQPAPYFDRKPVFRDEHDRQSVYDRVQKQWAQVHAATEDAWALEPHGETSALIYKNATKWTCQGCSMMSICEAHEIGTDWEDLMEATTQVWNPYAEHEIRAAEQK